MNKEEFFPTFLILIILLLLFIPLSLPIEGGAFFIIFGIIWFLYNLRKYSEFVISKIFFIFLLIIIYMFIFRMYVRPIPNADFVVQRILICIMLIVIMYTSIRNIDDNRPWENALIIMTIGMSLISILELYQWYSKYIPTIPLLQVIPDLQIAYRLQGNIVGNPNPFAGYLNFVWPIIAVRLYNSKRTPTKIIYWVALLLISANIFYANSRGAVLGALVGIAYLFFAAIIKIGFNNKKLISSINQYKKQMVITLGTLSLLAFGVLSRANINGQNFIGDFSGRGTIWKYSWAAFQENPLFGQGIGSFPISFTRLSHGWTLLSAHNLLIHLSAVYGLIGLIFMLILIITFLYFGIKILGEKGNEPLSFKLAYVAGGFSFLSQHMVDYMLTTVNYLVVSIVILVLLIKYVIKFGELRLSKKSFSIIGILLIGTLAFYQGIVSTTLMKTIDYSNLSQNVNNDEWMQFQEQICLSVDKYPNNSLYKFECSLSIIQQMISLNLIKSNINNQKMIDDAIFYQQEAYEENPFWAIQEANLGVLYWMNGDQEKAIILMRNAVRSDPVSEIVLLNLGWMEEEIGNKEEAISYYIRALRLNPLLNLSKFSQLSPTFNIASQDLFSWGESENLWDSWYDNSRIDRGQETRDHEFWKGVIALSTKQYQSAIHLFQNSIDSGNRSSSIYTYLVYSYMMDGQSDRADLIIKDIILLNTNGVRGIEGTAGYSIIASILHENGENDLAYNLMKNQFVFFQNLRDNEYYSAIYGHPFLISDISPLMIKTQNILLETEDDWIWFIEELNKRGELSLEEKVTNWRRDLPGIAKP